jgi:hypothetical protein
MRHAVLTEERDISVDFTLENDEFLFSITSNVMILGLRGGMNFEEVI